MKFSIEIPEDTLTKLVQDIALQRIKAILHEWSLSQEANRAIWKQWKFVEDRIIEGLFTTANLEAIERAASERIIKSIVSRTVRRGKERAAKISATPPEPPPAPPAEPT